MSADTLDSRETLASTTVRIAISVNGVVTYHHFDGWQVRIGTDPEGELVVAAPQILRKSVEVRVLLQYAIVIDHSGGVAKHNGLSFQNLPLPKGQIVQISLTEGVFLLIESAMPREYVSPASAVTAPIPSSSLKRTEGGHAIGRSRASRSMGQEGATEARPNIDEDPPPEPGMIGPVSITLIAGSYREPFRVSKGMDVLIGRARSCLVRIPSELEMVSPEHARLRWENGWLVLEDLQSSNGTRCDNSRISKVVLSPNIEHTILLADGQAILKVRTTPDVGSRHKRAGTPVSTTADAALDKASDRVAPASTGNVAEELPAAVTEQAVPLRAMEWLADLPLEVREVFRHIAEHGSINEQEATRLLGGARRFRNFSLHLDEYRSRAPFAVRVDVSSGTKCYVRGDL